MKFKHIVKDLLNPLPTTEGLLHKFWNQPLNHLFSFHMEAIISWILAEAKLSRNYGLFLRPQDLEKEVLVYLAFVNNFGGFNNLKSFIDEQPNGYDVLWKRLSQLEQLQFEKEKEYYFENLKKTKETYSPNAFGCHLESCRYAVLKGISAFPT